MSGLEWLLVWAIMLVCWVGYCLWDFAIALRAYLRRRRRDRDLGR